MLTLAPTDDDSPTRPALSQQDGRAEMEELTTCLGQNAFVSISLQI